MPLNREMGLLESAWKEAHGGQTVGVPLMLTGGDSPDSTGVFVISSKWAIYEHAHWNVLVWTIDLNFLKSLSESGYPSAEYKAGIELYTDFKRGREHTFPLDRKQLCMETSARALQPPQSHPTPPLLTLPPASGPVLWDKWWEGGGRANTPAPAWQGAQGSGPPAARTRKVEKKDPWASGHFPGSG